MRWLKGIFFFLCFAVAGPILVFYILNAYPILRVTHRSDDGAFRLTHRATFTFFAFPGQGCDGEGGLTLRNEDGKVIFESGTLWGLRCPPPHFFWKGRAFIAGKPETVKPLFLDLEGKAVRRVSEGEFRELLALPADEGRDELVSFIAGSRLGLDPKFLAQAAEELLKSRGSEALVHRIAHTLDPSDASALFLRLLAGREHREHYFEKVYGAESAGVWKKALETHFLKSDDAQAIAEGLGLLVEQDGLPSAEKKELFLRFLPSKDALVSAAAMRGMIETGFGAEVFPEALRRFYEAKPEDLDAYNSFNHPRETLQRAYDACDGKDPRFWRAIAFGLKHEHEGYWRSSFYFLRDNPDLKLTNEHREALDALRAKHPQDPQLTQQIDSVLKRP